jgi:Chromo (CHRromatin Organisation MOdifier) domain
MGNIHPTFHVSLLQPWHQRPGESSEEIQPLMIDDEEEREAEAILGERKYRGKKLQYLVKWLGWPSFENSWVDEDDLHAPELLEEYKRLLSEGKEAPRKGRRRKKT